MKNIIIAITLIIFSCGISIAQSTLQVNIEDCRQESSFEYLSEFKIYKNGTLFKTIEPKHESKQIIKNLAFGKYKIEYKTMFKRTENINIEISEKKKYSVDLCLNYINYDSESYKPFIDLLKNGEEYSIQVSSQGCFHSTDEKITITRKVDKYYLNYGATNKLLNNANIKAIREFEIELNYMESFGCTTSDTYVVKYKKKEVKISDGSCSWNGDYYLKKKLNLTKE